MSDDPYFPEAVDLSLRAIGAEDLLELAKAEIMLALQEQEAGQRQPGDCELVITIKVGLDENGLHVNATPKLKLPGHKPTGAVGMVKNGRMIVLDERANQAELPGTERVIRADFHPSKQ